MPPDHVQGDPLALGGEANTLVRFVDDVAVLRHAAHHARRRLQRHAHRVRDHREGHPVVPILKAIDFGQVKPDGRTHINPAVRCCAKRGISITCTTTTLCETGTTNKPNIYLVKYTLT